VSDRDRPRKEKESAKAKPQRPAEPATKPVQSVQRSPAWVGRMGGKPADAPKVQRAVAVSEPGDRFEREADRVAQRVKSGDQVPKDSISRVGTDGQGVGQRAAAEPAKPKDTPAPKKEQPGPKPAAQREGKVRDKKEAAAKSTEDKLKDAPIQRSHSAAASEAKAEESALRAEEKSLAGPVQKSAEPQDRNLVRPKEEPDRDAGTAAAVQRKEAGPSPTEAAAQRAIESKGSGKPIQPDTRQRLEHGLGADLGDVRVHDDPAAQKAARDLDARAFAHGKDIWLGAGESQKDVGLMAHESAHVLQQTGASSPPIQRVKPPAGPSADWDYQDDKFGKVKKGSRLVIPKLRVPKFKKPLIKKPVVLPKKTDEGRPTNQKDLWEKDIKDGVIGTKLDKKLKDEGDPGLRVGGKPVVYMAIKGKPIYVLGSRETVLSRLWRPYWDKDGRPENFHVDHMHEWQLGGDHDITNFWLLDADSNIASGQAIKSEKDTRIQQLLDAAEKKGTWSGKAPTLAEVRKSYIIEFESVEGSASLGIPPKASWTAKQIKDDAKHLDALKTLTKKEIDARGLQGDLKEIVVYTNRTGGGRREAKASDKVVPVDWKFGKRVAVDKVFYDRDKKAGWVNVSAYKGSPIVEKIETQFDIQEHEAVQYGGFVAEGSIANKLSQSLKIKKASPVVIEMAELTDRGIVGRGKVKPTIPLIKNVELDLILDGDDVYVSKTFAAGDFNFPGPIKATDATLVLFAGTRGIGVEGNLFFEIERVGKGKIKGEGSTGQGFAVSGQFEFDTKLFDPAKIEAKYANGKFSASGEIGIPPDKVKGIKSARLSLSIDDGVLDAKGTVKPSIPGVEQADLQVTHSEADGLLIAGHLELKKDIPGIESGSVDVTVKRPPGSEDYKVKAAGTATPKIPGVAAQINVLYDDGAFDINGTAAYEKGMLKGALAIGATNRPVGEDGNPAGAPPGKAADKITLYGGGSLSLRIAPWLQATAGVRLLPNGEIEVTGRIGLPQSLELFKEKKLDKNLFKIGIDIPIIGVSAAGQRVGIFANITGGLDLSAGIGPGELQDLHLEVTYNPAHEDQTHVSGAAKLHIPAHAGLRMFVRGSLGVGIPLVSASAGLEFGGSLGLEGALDAAVNVDWTPVKGLDIQASAEIYVQPKLKFDITGFVLVELDLLLTTIELYSKRWQLASVEYGSDLRFGLKLPIHYHEGTPFDLSFDNVQFVTPNISAKDVLSGLVKKIA
jgi:hypothetical protein